MVRVIDLFSGQGYEIVAELIAREEVIIVVWAATINIVFLLERNIQFHN